MIYSILHHKPVAEPADVFTRQISLQGNLSPEQRQRLLEIAERCPVHRTLEQGAAVESTLEVRG